ncbi:substrate-binding periplasmic protein [Chitinilyticum aquatile]|uniref:substrate-binding periplasmic protein n=1 Tax=Chitinilyticum aquatile TaxID=362520 RepID=UPI0003F8B682|nr:transporter substrate-binding domain-containing protein [Chitinilyticum aquatile]
MRHLLILLLLVLGLAVTGTAQAEDKEILIFGDIDYKPVSWQENGEMHGLAVAAVAHIRRSTGLPVRLVLQPWNRSYKAALAGEGGVIGLSHTRERAQLFDYSPLIYESQIRLTMLQNRAFPFDGVHSLRGRKVGGQLGASYGEEIDNAVKTGSITMIRDTSIEVRLRNLLAGNIDCILMSSNVKALEDAVREVQRTDPELMARAGKLVTLDKPVQSDPVYLAFRKDSLPPEIRQRIFDALSRWKVPAQYQ